MDNLRPESLQCKLNDLQVDRQEAIDAIRKNNGVILDKPRITSYVTLDSRKRTFNNCELLAGNDTETEMIAEAGFWFDNQTRKFTCYHCEISLNPFQSEDPWIIHVQNFPYCAHARHCKGDAYVLGILQQTDRTSISRCETTLERIFKINKTAIDAVKENYGNKELIDKAVEFIVQRNERQTFTGIELAKAVEELEKSGFNNTIEEVKQTPGTRKKDSSAEDQRTREIEEENERLSTAMKCKICLKNLACIIILPCGHLSTCAQCVSALWHCPICRVNVQGTIRAVFATSAEVDTNDFNSVYDDINSSH